MIKKGWLWLSVLSLLLALFSVYNVSGFLKWIQPDRLNGHQMQLSWQSPNVHDHQGNEINWRDVSQRPFYIATGFTSCPHSCPAIMANLQVLAKHFGDQAYYFFLTIDPQRDTPQTLADYVSAYDSRIVGIRTDDDALLRSTLGALAQSFQLSSSNTSISHQNRIYLIHPSSEGLILYDGNRFSISQIKHDFEVLSQTSNSSLSSSPQIAWESSNARTTSRF